MKEKKDHKVNISPISKLEKSELKNKIFYSIRKERVKKQRIKYVIGGIAASISLVIGLNFYMNSEPTMSITDFVESTKNLDSNSSDEVVLILSEGENLKADEAMTTINYSSTGQNVTVGNAKTVEQQVIKNNKVVYNTLLVPYGKRSKIKLSDGTIAWLNSGSKLIYPVVFNGDRREVYIQGEAIFDVTHNKNKPFIVISDDQEIEVLGTVFGVTNYKDDTYINTVLESGSVQISYHSSVSSSKNTDKLKITPGTLANYDKSAKSIVSKKVNVENYFAWRDGVLIFNQDKLQFIMKKLARHYNVDIDINDEVLANETFSGYLDLNEDLNQVVQTIKESANMETSLLDEKIIITN
tara:strand:- start:71764 stop:72825 length:1062 start_codon:yes stop_codon:yes gene_type:complete